MPLINRTFSDIITFTRASAATMFDSTGTLVYAPMNAIRNSSASGAVAGTPGTAPTNWAIPSPSSGLSAQIIGTGVEAGITYIDVRYFGTATGTNVIIAFETNSQIAALNGQTWTNSVWVKGISGAANNYTLRTSLRDSGGAGLGQIDTLFTPTSTLTRFFNTGTLADASVAFVAPQLRFGLTIGVAYDITLRIGLPQLELGSVARTAIATSGTAYQGPRFDYDPVTLAAKGMLIEEQRTNLAFPSNMPTSTVQTVTGNMQANGATQITSGVVAPDGSTNGFTISGASATTNSNGANNVRILSAITSALTYTVSMWIKTNGSTTTVTVRDASSGTAVNVPTTTNWTRESFTLTSTAASNIIILSIAGAAFDCFGIQVETASFPTSYIPTTTAAATRAADVASVNTLAPWYNATEGTLFAQANLISSSYSGGVLLDVGAGGAFGTTEYIAWNGTAWTLNPNIAPLNVVSTVTTVSTAKVAVGLKVNDSVISANSLIGITDTSCGIASSPTTLSIGKAGWLGSANYFNGWLRRIGYYKRRLSNAQLQAITQ